MKDHQFLKGLAVGLMFSVVFLAGRVSAGPLPTQSDAQSLSQVLERIARDGVTVKGSFEKPIEVRLKSESDVAINSKHLTFPVEVRK